MAAVLVKRSSILEDAEAILSANGWEPDAIHRFYLPDESYPSPTICFVKRGEAMTATIELGGDGVPEVDVTKGW